MLVSVYFLEDAKHAKEVVEVASGSFGICLKRVALNEFSSIQLDTVWANRKNPSGND